VPVLLLLRGRRRLRMTRADLGRTLLLGVLGIASSNYTYYLSIQRTTVATAIILQYTAPIWVLLYMVARGLQRATLRRVASVALAVVGSALAIGLFGQAKFHPDLLGVVAGQAASFAFAFYTVYASLILRTNDRWTALLYSLLGAALFWMLVNPPWRVMAQHYSAQQWEYLVLFSIVSALIPFSLYFAGLQMVDATRAVVTSCFEPVFTIIIAAVALGELVKPLQVVGIVVVLVATIVVQLPEKAHHAEAADLTL
jgi:drug/metabolite transporter (DMT)-like permease